LESKRLLWLTLVPLFTALITVGAYIRIPTPFIPITFQVFFVILTGLLLGPKMAVYSTLVYLLLGLFGIPVFTEGGGFSYIFKPTFGYIIGFVFGSFVTGTLSFRKNDKYPSFKRMVMAFLLGVLTIYLFGVTYFLFVAKAVLNLPLTVSAILTYGFLMVIPGDLITGVIAVLIAKRLNPILKIR